ncbi:MAG: Asp-tRNA(Asn)/Glu-tRNA(Gln) amidotransferase subunit GatC [Candidatus Magasanikbacteria bacterium]|nr:Asp-tRNA(Asn)/Glu-tRNA(Gln) amidotransferase subunit GatC [Candidatus Magasanikbacteria bacterium]
MSLSIEEVEQIADLARLALSEEEKSHYGAQLSAILEYVGTLEKLDTDEIEETCQVTGLEDVFREDIAEECDKKGRKKILDSFPDKEGNFLKVRAVFLEN